MEIGSLTTVLGVALLAAAATAGARGFDEDVAFLKRHVEVLVPRTRRRAPGWPWSRPGSGA